MPTLAYTPAEPVGRSLLVRETVENVLGIGHLVSSPGCVSYRCESNFLKFFTIKCEAWGSYLIFARFWNLCFWDLGLLAVRSTTRASCTWRVPNASALHVKFNSTQRSGNRAVCMAHCCTVRNLIALALIKRQENSKHS